ncbi:ANTAR domain-containing protein [Kineococcus xinjiangensis]|uniref:ANTAR domain-containing protein n=1 Tax=Kineococcus xinjiangensis TaxID=512762 RepID=A0A2S6IUT0_9ACTN|nr:GAF and ANTAR domain-containing protein [Kineococcus xinjiangensis]PPK97939.1 ANTAR domain-containing protein [Kineococcus xinjiangensis]
MTSARSARILGGLRATSTGGLAPEVCAASIRATGVDGAGLSLAGNRGPVVVVAATAGLGRTLEDLQVHLGEGPCADAWLSGEPVSHPELARSAHRWPALGPAALEAGARAAFAFPVTVGSVRLGTLSLYRSHPEDLGPREVDEAIAHAGAAGSALLQLRPADDGAGADGEADAVRRAVRADRYVHQATGMVSEQLHCSLDDALARLRAHAYAGGRTVAELARDVVARRVRFSPEDP